VKDTTAFMQSHSALIEKLIEEKPPALRHFFTPSLFQSPPNMALSISVKDIFAIPASERVEGKECPITFVVRVLGEFEFLELEFDSPPLADHPVLPGATFQQERTIFPIPSWGTGGPRFRSAVRGRRIMKSSIIGFWHGAPFGARAYSSSRGEPGVS
jgi:hypothetical protein